jgi:2-polyprenyl-3-methyl-5-hydroxy-6-metoxy-1,4-benzoquinol methylase
MTEARRHGAFGQHAAPTLLDRLGQWLSWRRILGSTPLTGARVADVGCGYQAPLARRIADLVSHVTLFDLALAPELTEHPNITAHTGRLPETLAKCDDEAFDVIVCNNVLEHLWEPHRALEEFWRLTAPGGTVIVNVPSWLGKRALEFSAFRLGASPAEEMNDHKRYYDQVGFRPRDITCRRHKLALNTFARCRKPD